MTDDANALLRRALEFLNDAPRFGLRRDPSVHSYKLANDIEAFFARPRTAADLCQSIREWLDEDDPSHWGEFERELDRIISADQ